MFGAITHAQYTLTLLKKVSCGYMTFYNKDSKSAELLGYGQRLVSGWKPVQEKEPIPDCLKHEKGLRC